MRINSSITLRILTRFLAQPTRSHRWLNCTENEQAKHQPRLRRHQGAPAPQMSSLDFSLKLTVPRPAAPNSEGLSPAAFLRRPGSAGRRSRFDTAGKCM
jgi:hypothetical protein